MKSIDYLRKLFLLLTFSIAGFQGALADGWVDDGSYGPIDGVTYRLYHYSYNFVAEILKIETNAEEVVIPKTITKDYATYNVKYVGYNPKNQSSSYYVRVESSKCPNLKTVRFQGDINICHTFILPGVTKMVFDGDLAIRQYGAQDSEYPNSVGTLEVNGATELVLNGRLLLSGALFVLNLTELRLRNKPEFYDTGIIYGNNLQRIYFGNKANLPSWYGTYRDHFSTTTNPVACMYQATSAEINKYKTQSDVWSQF